MRGNRVVRPFRGTAGTTFLLVKPSPHDLSGCLIKATVCGNPDVPGMSFVPI